MVKSFSALLSDELVQADTEQSRNSPATGRKSRTESAPGDGVPIEAANAADADQTTLPQQADVSLVVEQPLVDVTRDAVGADDTVSPTPYIWNC